MIGYIHIIRSPLTGYWSVAPVGEVLYTMVRRYDEGIFELEARAFGID